MIVFTPNFLALGTLLLLLANWTSAASCISPYAPHDTIPYGGSICNLPEQPAPLDLKVTHGAIPSWMEGTLFRNVPAQYSFGSDQVRHWFDGMAQIQAYHFYSGNNSASVHTRFLETTSFTHFNETQKMDEMGFGTPANPGRLVFPNTSTGEGVKPLRHRQEPPKQKQKVSAGKFGPVMALNTNVCIFYLAGKFFATTDDATMVEFDGETLETLSPNGYAFADGLPSGFGVSHGAMDDGRGEYFNMVQDFAPIFTGGATRFYFWKFSRDKIENQTGSQWAREVVSTVLTVNSTYSHSIGLTEHYIVWLELPYVTDKYALMFGLPLAYAFEDLSESVPMRMHLISRTNASDHVVAEVPNYGCTFHTGNVYEDPTDGSVVYDSARSHDCAVYDGFFLEEMLTQPTLPQLSTGFAMTRCRFHRGGGGNASDAANAHCSDLVTDGPTQFPWYNKQFHMKPYRYAYATLPARTTTTGELRKMDLTINATVAVFSIANLVLTEALFVPQFPHEPATASNEDKGALITVAYNVSSQLSEILAVNASSMELMFAIALPFAVPIHFHGIFCGPKTASGVERFCLWT